MRRTAYYQPRVMRHRAKDGTTTYAIHVYENPLIVQNAMTPKSETTELELTGGKDAKEPVPPWRPWLLYGFLSLTGGFYIALVGAGGMMGDGDPSLPSPNRTPFLLMMLSVFASFPFAIYCFARYATEKPTRKND